MEIEQDSLVPSISEEVFADDNFFLGGRQRIERTTKEILGLSALVSIEQKRRRQMKHLRLSFAIPDPETKEFLGKSRRIIERTNPEDLALLFEFSAGSRTFGSYLEPVLSGKLEAMSLPVMARLGFALDNRTFYSKPLFSMMLAVHSDFPVYVFDCHSIWKLYEFRTYCETFGDCSQCWISILEGWQGGRTTALGFHTCWCYG